MSRHASQIRSFVITPSLKIANLWSESADILIYATGMIESGYSHIIQPEHPSQGGLGYWMMDNSMYIDTCKWLKGLRQKPILNNILACCYYDHLPGDAGTLAWNIKLAMLMCRAHYLKSFTDLPSASDATGLAQYYIDHYDSFGCAADLHKNTEIFEGIINGLF